MMEEELRDRVIRVRTLLEICIWLTWAAAGACMVGDTVDDGGLAVLGRWGLFLAFVAGTATVASQLAWYRTRTDVAFRAGVNIGATTSSRITEPHVVRMPRRDGDDRTPVL